MTKNTYIVAAMLYSLLSYGQQITFHENVNYRASTLQQSLNKEGDSLILKSENKEILQVQIFNESFSENINVNSISTRIDLKTLPIGNFVIQAKLDQKWITMYLEKKDDVKIASLDQKKHDIGFTATNKSNKFTSSEQKKQDKDQIGLETKRKSNRIGSSNQKEHDIANNSLTIKRISNKTAKQNNSLYYWVVSEINSNSGSSKTMRLEYKDDIAKLISKNKLELKSNVGKNNKLIIYEVYNTSKFMPKQLRNPKYYKTEESTFFNVVPVYASRDEEEISNNP